MIVEVELSESEDDEEMEENKDDAKENIFKKLENNLEPWKRE